MGLTGYRIYKTFKVFRGGRWPWGGTGYIYTCIYIL